MAQAAQGGARPGLRLVAVIRSRTGRVRVFGNIEKDEKRAYFLTWLSFLLALAATAAVLLL